MARLILSSSENPGILNIYDILILLDIILDNSNYQESADMNYDQILNIQDILILIQQVLEV